MADDAFRHTPKLTLAEAPESITAYLMNSLLSADDETEA